MSNSRRIVILLFDRLQSLDATGPAEVLSLADRHAGGGEYRLEFVAPAATPLRTSSGLQIVPTHGIADCQGEIDTLLIAGGTGTRDAAANQALLDWLRRTAPRCRRVASVCTGAFLLAAAGLLHRRRATTHWAACAALARLYPDIEVQRDPIFVRDGNVFTSAGITAGIDLALALVEEDLGPQVALAVARQLVLFVRRPGGQEQFSAALAGQTALAPSLRQLQSWMVHHPEADLSVAALAERLHMSERHLSRLFTQQVGMTPAAYVQSIRLERARLLLQGSDLALEQVALQCGFGTVETMRRTFARRLRVSPSEYRARFAPAEAA